jgi:hypothetical protein
MKQIKIFFDDYGRYFDNTEETILKLLRQNYDVLIDPHPDYLFFSSGGYNHLGYPHECVKIFYTGENQEPNFNVCDYALAHSYIQFEDRYFRSPYFRFRTEVDHVNDKITTEQALDRKFCNFVYSSGWADPIRNQFFQKLSEYKHVDSGGQHLNNIGYRVKDKMKFISNYKFTVAFENSTLNGYTTEKILQPIAAHSLPIYWGNHKVKQDFNYNAFVCVNDFNSLDDAVEEIIRLDNNHQDYLEKLNASPLLQTQQEWETQLKLFLINIFEQNLHDAKRVAHYGCQYAHRRDLYALNWSFQKNKYLAKGLRKLFRLQLNAKKVH